MIYEQSSKLLVSSNYFVDRCDYSRISRSIINNAEGIIISRGIVDVFTETSSRDFCLDSDEEFLLLSLLSGFTSNYLFVIFMGFSIRFFETPIAKF